mgnify:FL=1
MKFSISRTYHSDTGKGGRDGKLDIAIGRQVVIKGGMDEWNNALRTAIELKAPLIVRTSYRHEKAPGAWYIKGLEPLKGWKTISPTTDIIEKKLTENEKKGLYSSVQAWVLRY